MQTTLDTGTAFSHTRGHHDADLTEVRRDTPMGSLMRRYWQPIGLSSYATELPRQVRVLGEDLILFRDKQGRPGLVYPRCVHRGSSLLYARVDDSGIRCCYHGWAFDVQGRCVDQPCEPNNGAAHRGKVVQPWYPVEERYGLLFAYLGPADRKPLLPRYSALEELGPGEQLFTDDHNIGSGRFSTDVVPFNWLQHFENIHDTAHFYWLHYFHSGPQFGVRFGEFDKLDWQPWERLGDVSYFPTERGVSNERTQTLPDGRSLRTVVETVLPGIRGVPNPFGANGVVDALGFMLPVDDTGFRIFTVLRAKDDMFFQRIAQMTKDRRAAVEADPHYHQRFPGDWEAQGSQGGITLHSEEHLATGDQGIIALRRLLRRQLQAIQAGGNPINVAFEPGTELVKLEAGNYLSGEAREAPVAAVTQSPTPPNHHQESTMSATGQWKVVVQSPMGPEDSVFALKAEGTSLEGTVQTPKETVPLTQGKADGDKLHWMIRVTHPMAMNLEFSATVSGDKIEGKARSAFGAVPFAGQRA